MEVIGVGLLGCGIVGSSVARILHEHADDIALRLGARLEIRAVAVRNLSKDREVPIDSSLFTDDPAQVVARDDVQIVVEVIGGIEPARSLILQALAQGKAVATANKELMASLGKELFDASDAANTDLFFEAAVAGGIPIIRPMKESLAGERIVRVTGIVNGTTNFILTRMSEDGMEFSEALGEAKRLGYTELDPSADIEGFDPAAKIAILACIAFNARVVAGDVYREGITQVTQRDILFAHTLGYEVKLLAVAEISDGEIAVRVHPAMIPSAHPLASVRDNFNAIFVEGEQAGELMFYGRGAGGPPTGISVVGDVIDAARNKLSGSRGVACTCYHDEARIRHMDEMVSQYYLLLAVEDQPGVLAKVSSVFGEHGVSISSVWQEGHGDEAQLVLITHRAKEGNVQQMLKALKALDAVLEVSSFMRVEAAEG